MVCTLASVVDYNDIMYFVYMSKPTFNEEVGNKCAADFAWI
jgi:hypothetical protein